MLEVIGHGGPFRGPRDEEDHLVATINLVDDGCDAGFFEDATRADLGDWVRNGSVCYHGRIVP